MTENTKKALSGLEKAIEALVSDNEIKENEFLTKQFAGKAGVSISSAKRILTNFEQKGKISVRKINYNGSQTSVYAWIEE